MAILREFVASNGVRVQVRDDCLVGVSAEEMAAREDRLKRTALNLLRAEARREMRAVEGARSADEPDARE